MGFVFATKLLIQDDGYTSRGGRGSSGSALLVLGVRRCWMDGDLRGEKNLSEFDKLVVRHFSACYNHFFSGRYHSCICVSQACSFVYRIYPREKSETSFIVSNTLNYFRKEHIEFELTISRNS